MYSNNIYYFIHILYYVSFKRSTIPIHSIYKNMTAADTLSIGIDQSLSITGIVVLDTSTIQCNEMIDHKLIITDKQSFIDNYDRTDFISNVITTYVTSYYRQYSDVIVNVEGLSFNSNGRGKSDLAGLLHLIISKLRNQCVTNVHIRAIGSIKKHHTRNGHADKFEMFEALPEGVKKIFNTYGKTRGRYDLTDAYATALMWNFVTLYDK